MCVFGNVAVMAAESTSYPSKPVRLVVEFSPGGSSDTAGRALARQLSELLGQNFVVDNRSGANGAIAAELVAKAAADGYTLMIVTIAYATAAATETRLPYDLARDFAPVSQVTQSPYVLVVSPSLPVASLQELIALAKSKPGEFNYGSTGTGGSNHLVTELFNAAAGLRMVHVPYKGPPPALADVAAGRLQLMFASIISGVPLARGGRVRALAVTSAKRVNALPDIPAVAETIADCQAVGWTGVVAPKATPAVIVKRLAEAIAQGLQLPDAVARFVADGSEVKTSTPAEFDRFMRSELTRYAQLVKAAGIRVQ